MNTYEQILEHKSTLKKSKAIIKAMDHTVRLSILKFIQTSGRASVTQIYFGLRLEQSVASQHLAILRKANIVKTEREGKNIYYSIDEEGVTRILSTLAGLN